MITLTARALRIRNDELRIAVLFLLFLPDVGAFFLFAPFKLKRKSRLLEADFWWLPVDLYLAGMQGAFVDLPIESTE